MSNDISKTGAVSSGDQARSASRLGKEAKIGVSVIAFLLLVLGIVATIRLTSSNAGEDVAVAEGPKDVKPQGSTSTASMLNETVSNRFSSKPTTPPKIVSDWKQKTEPPITKPTSSVPTAPPSFVPPPPTSPQGDRFSRFPAKSPADTHHGKRDEKTNGESSYTINDTSKPTVKDVQKDDAEKVMDDAKPLPGMHPLRPEGSTGQSRVADLKKPDRVSGRDHFVAVEPPATLPGYRERATQPSMPPASTVDAMPQRNTDSGAGLTTVTPAQFDAAEYRAETSTMPRGGNERFRSPAARSSSPVARRDDGKYEVQPNDSYWTVSERLYGTGAYFKAIAQHNRGKDGEDQLRPGELILAPTVAELEKTYPELCPTPGHRDAMQSQARASTVSTRGQLHGGRTYTVVEGDTLFNIARYELGKASRWAELYDLNREVLGKDFNYLKPGIQLVMPAGERGESVASPPSRGYTR